MENKGRIKPYEASDFFRDGQSARPLVEGTIAYNWRLPSDPLLNARVDGKLVSAFPIEITPEVLARGQQQFTIFCSPCHGPTGDGNGMIVQRGFTRPPTYHDERLRNAPVGHFYDVITNGYGAMYSYSERISPEDRWGIAAYIRVLQLSQHAPENMLSEVDRNKANNVQ